MTIVNNRTFKGHFNWYGEIHTLTTLARGKDLAYMKLTGALSKKLQTIPNRVRAYFGTNRNNYEIKEVINEREE